MNTYSILRIDYPHNTAALHDNPLWISVQPLTISHFRPESSDHRPQTEVRVFHTGSAVHILFSVQDNFVKCTRTEYQSDVWRDSCVEWFVQPKDKKGYFNFEINSIGTLHVHYIEDPIRINGQLRKSVPISYDIGKLVSIASSVREPLSVESTTPFQWHISMVVPLIFFEHFVGPIGNLSNQKWRANFNKCADQSSHPTWATWNPVAELNFHRPMDFGEIVFE